MKLIPLFVTAAVLATIANHSDGPLQAEGWKVGALRTPTVQVAQARQDLPWTPADTGTVRPGMTRDQVVAVWGMPATERTIGEWTYMYYRNGCERSCGIHDVVFLENGQVVNAIVRGRGHTYAGMSSSPPGQTPEFTPRRPNPMEQ